MPPPEPPSAAPHDLAETLERLGPRVTVSVRPLHMPEGPSHDGVGLIDTGADVTVIDNTFATNIGCTIAGSVSVVGVLTSDVSAVYAAMFDIVSVRGIMAGYMIGAQLESSGLAVLIGRDVLRHCEFTYDGPTGRFSLSAPQVPVVPLGGGDL